MDVKRLRAGELIAAVGGLALLASMFLPWYRGPKTGLSENLNAWEAFNFLWVALLLTIVVIMATGLVVLRMAQRSAELPVALNALTTGMGTLSVAWISFRIIDPIGDPDYERRIGLYVGLIAVVLVAYGGWRSIQEGGDSEGTAFPEQPPSPLPPSPPPPPPPTG
jgi:hypothetical protein